MAPRIDYAVEVIGPLVSGMHASVQQLWQTVCRAHLQPLRKSLLREDIVQEVSGNMRAALLLRDNILHRSDIEDAYLSMIKSAKSEILIANAYFLPGLRFRHALRDAAQRGVRVTLLLQGRTDHLFVGLASQALYSALLGQGVRIYEYHKSFMHSKVAVADDRWAMVGSSNIDPFSLMLSREANILIKDDGFARELRQDIEASINAGATLLSADEWQQRHYVKRFFSWFLYGLVRLLVGVIGHANNY
jgi:cardiolipin synthase A/B